MSTSLRPASEVRSAVLDRLGVDRAEVFRHTAVDVDGGTVALRYDLEDIGAFTETFAFDDLDVASVADTPAVSGALHLLHLVAGVSYLKTVLPRAVDPGPLDAATAPLLAALLTDGLGEFAWVNGIDLHDWFRLPTPSDESSVVPAPSLDAGPLVPVGGGKDSIVTLEALRTSRPTLFAVNPRGPIARTIDAAGLPAVTVRRTLDPALFDLNDRGALNGHVPVTAIVSAAAVVAAAVRGHDAVVLSNEASADEPTLVIDGRAVNHQWSKSSAFEHLFAAAVRRDVHPRLDYLSFLRPASELAIARRFAALDGYDAAFNSCNRAFHLRGATTEWCGDCPKCRFVALVLAPFMAPQRLTAIMGRDLLDDPAQADGVAALAGLRDQKPFECVGTEDESRAALACLASRDEWRDHAVVRQLAAEVTPGCVSLDAFTAAAAPDRLPERFREAFRAAF